jgi:penicillin G amidase
MKKAILVLGAVLLTAAAAACVRMSVVKARYEKAPSLPVVDGKIKAAGLSGPVDVYRDQYGVPHVFSDNEHDLFFGVGYVQAQDRLWEMVLLRAMAEGRTGELFGDIGLPGGQMVDGFMLSTSGIDRQQRTMGLRWLGEVGEAFLAHADPAIQAQLQAYCDGINAFIADHPESKDLPIEFQVLKVKPEPFRIADLMSLNLFIGYMLSANMDQELARYALFKRVGPDLGWKLMPLHDSLGPTIVPKELLRNRLPAPRELPPGGRPSEAELGYSFADLNLTAEAAEKIQRAETAIKTALYVDHPYASNNWVIGPKLSKTGHAILCNDPHLEHFEPSLMYLMHIKGAGFDSYGATFPGNPYLVLGHARKLAWGETTTSADVQDLYVETVSKDHPGKYRYQGEWRPFTVREEIIRVKVPTGFVSRRIKVRQTVHGPVMNDAIPGLPPGTPPLALRWTAWDLNRDLTTFERVVTSATIDELLAKFSPEDWKRAEVMSGAHMFNILMKGATIEDFKKGVDKLVVPNQNWVAADADGHIAYVPAGLVPVRKKGLGIMPVPGASGEFDWAGFIPTMELPIMIDPERGYVATANNEVVDAEWYPYVFATDYGDGWRAARIEELIQQLAPLGVDEMRRIQNDVQVKEAAWLVPKVLAAVDRQQPRDRLTQQGAAELRAWNFEADLDNTATVLFFTLTKTIRHNVFAGWKDPKGKPINASFKLVETWIEKGDSEFFDNPRTDQVETLDDVLVKSLGDAMRAVEKKYGKDPSRRQWGKLHYIKWYSPFGWGPLKDMSVGPLPHIGANNTVRNAVSIGIGRDPWKALGGPVLRHIMDLGDPDHALMIIDGSQSGQWLSPHYQDLHPIYNDSGYITAEMRPDQVKASAKEHLVLEP